MRQSVLKRAGSSQVEERPIPTCGPDDVLVRVAACGVCASELHRWRSPKGVFPQCMGHEVVGAVAAAGENVSHLHEGMLVTGLFHEGFAEYAIAPAEHVVPLPESVSILDGLGEPLACVISAYRRIPVEQGMTVAIIGLGFMGLLMLQVVSLKKPGRIIAIDIREDALASAISFGATESYVPEELPTDLHITSWHDRHKPYGANVVIEATGKQEGLTLAGEITKVHGFLAILGFHQGAVRQVDMALWNWKALTVLNAHERRDRVLVESMRMGLDFIASGKLRLKPLVTHTYTLDQVDDAFRALAEKPQGFVKAAIVPTAHLPYSSSTKKPTSHDLRPRSSSVSLSSRVGRAQNPQA